MSLMERIGVYLRISEDKDGTQTATARQLEDCTKWAADRGFNIVDVFEDIDLSAYKRTVKRPEFERMLSAVRDRDIDGVVAWKIDRISRRQRDLVRLDEECEEAGGFIVTVVDGIDTRQPTGRFVAEMLVAQARMESENSSVRIARAMEAMAKSGRPAAGGTRPFGYTMDRRRVISEEAELIKEATRRVLEGESIRRVCMEWERRGVLSPAGKPWQVPPMRRLLTNPMLSGQRVYKETLISGQWPAILSAEDTARLRLLLLDPARRKQTSNARTSLLSGFLRCGRCGGNLVSRPRGDKVRRYVCALQPGQPNCGKLARLAEPIEEVVTEALFIALEDADLSGFLKGRERRDMRALEEATRADEAALDQLIKDHQVDHIISRAEWLAARVPIEERLARTRRRAAEDRGGSVLGVLMAGAKLREQWAVRPLDWKRAVLGIVIDYIVIEPAVPGLNKFDPNLVRPVWRF
jgi:site-specific DNA recombinase